MDPELLQFLVATGGSLLAGGAVKKASKQNASESHKALSPAVVALISIVANMAFGERGPQLAVEAGQAAAAAIAIHSAAKNIIQVFRKKGK